MSLADCEEDVGLLGSLSSKLDNGHKIPFWTVKWVSHNMLYFPFAVPSLGKRHEEEQHQQHGKVGCE